MTTKREIQERKACLRRDVLQAQESGTLVSGEMTWSHRELSARYGLSLRTISLYLQTLAGEGVLHTVPGVGTFGGRAHSVEGRTFLFVTPYALESNVQLMLVHRAFEATIATRGGSCLTLQRERAQALAKASALPEIAGLFEFEQRHSETSVLGAKSPVPRAVYVENESGAVSGVMSCDGFDFDQRDGGYQATRHLLLRGHRKIAFLGLHSASGGMLWSRQRAEGWREALREAEVDSGALEFVPARFASGHEEQARAARAALRRLLPALNRSAKKGRVGKSGVEAVVTANHVAARELFAVLRLNAVPHGEWPSIVAFDDEPANDSHLVSTLRLPWDEMGAQAAQLLCARAVGQGGETAQRLIKMNLMPRLTSHSQWSRPDMAELLMPMQPAVSSAP